MPTAYKVLGQVAGAASNTNLYTVPAATSAVASTLVICNRSTTGKQYRIMVRPAGETLANKHYLTYDSVVAANDSINLTLGITLATTDVVDIYATDSNVSFTLFGSEIS
jgi:hypothetical protein